MFTLVSSLFSNCTFSHWHCEAIIPWMRQILKNGTSLLFRKQTSILSAAFIIMVTYGLSHLIGLFKTRLLISHFFGSSSQLLDVYYAALVIPDTIFQLLIIGALSAAFIPTFTRSLSNDREEAWAMATSTMNLVLALFLVISITIFVFAHQLAPLIAPGFTPPQISILVQLMRIMLLAQLFFSISGFLTSIIQSHQRFLIPALAPIAYNFGIIFGILFLSPSFGIFGPTIGMVIGACVHMLIQLPLAIRLGFRFRFNFNFSHPGVREVARLLPPRAVALGVDQVEQFVAVILTSSLLPGSLSLLNVARLLYAIPNLLFGSTIGQAALPTLSRIADSSDQSEFRRTLSDSFLQVSFLALPVSILFIVLRIPIVRIVFGAKTFPWLATLLTGKTLAILALSASFYAVMQLVIRGFYSLHDTKTPLIVGLTAALFNTIFSVIVVTRLGWGILGIAFAISLTAIIESIVLTLILARRLGGLVNFSSTLKTLTRMLFATFVTGTGLWFFMRLLDKFIFDTTRTLPLIALTVVTSLIGFSVYIGLSYLLKVEQLFSYTALLLKLRHFKTLFSAPTSPEPLIVPAPDQN